MQVLRNETTHRFMHAYWGIRQKMFREIGPLLQASHGVDLPEYFLLQYISESDLSPSEIAEAMQLPPHAVSRKLDSLEKAGLIERSLHPEDARRRVLTPTASGQTALAAATETVELEMQKMLSVLSDSDLEHLIGALHTLSAS